MMNLVWIGTVLVLIGVAFNFLRFEFAENLVYLGLFLMLLAIIEMFIFVNKEKIRQLRRSD